MQLPPHPSAQFFPSETLCLLDNSPPSSLSLYVYSTFTDLQPDMLLAIHPPVLGGQDPGFSILKLQPQTKQYTI